jgi:hypothetical protein
MKLGKLAPKHNPKTLDFASYLLPKSIAPPPTKAYWEYKVPPAWNMYGNDTCGDCTCAAAAHLLMNWTAHTSSMVAPALEEVMGMYSAISGYDPVSGANDNGAAITDVLDYLQKTGLSGHKIDGWAQIDHTNLDHVRMAIYLFGGINIGVQLPMSAMDQNNAHATWDVLPDDGGIDGGHSIPNFGYGATGTTAVTWGALQPMTWEWFKKYCDEAYVLLSLDWLATSGLAPSHLDVVSLRADLQELRV